MRAIRTGLKYSSRSCTSLLTALVLILTWGISATTAMAQVPASGQIVINQSTSYGSFSSGGSQSGAEPAGDSMAVNTLGQVITTTTYGNQTLLFTAAGGTPTVLGTTNNPNGVAVDAQNNLYMGFSYNNSVVKVPFLNGAYATIGAAGSANPYPSGTPNCTGTDTAECVMSNLNVGASVYSLVFDPSGNLFFTTATAIYECTAACLYSGTPAPALLYTEPTSATPSTTGQLTLGGLALDTSNNIFFTDSAVSSTTSQESFSSNLKELPFTTGTGYATSPTLIYAYTPAAVAQYGAEIDGVGVAPDGTVYALIQAAQGSQAGSPPQGIVAFPKVSGAYSGTSGYLVSTQSGKLMTNDAHGNLYIADNNGGIYQIAINSLTAPPTPTGTPSTATNLTTLLNDGGCTSTPPTVTFTPGGASAADFALTTTGACTATATGASYATSLTFTPTVVGTATATVMLMDSVGSTGTANASGEGTGTVAEPTFLLAAGTYSGTQQLTISDATVGASIYYTTDGSTPAAGSGTSALYSGPISITASETVNAIAVDTGDTNSTVASATYIINPLPPTDTPVFSVPAGTYTSPQAVTIYDSAPGAAIYYTTNGSTPTTASALYVGPITVSTTETLSAIAVASGFSNSATASALYTINLPPSAFQNVVLSQETELGALPTGGGQSGQEPAGDTMAVNSNGAVIMGNTYGSQVLLFPAQGGTPTVLGTPGNNPAGMAVDSQNNLYVAFATYAGVVKVPYVNGAYVPMGAPGSAPYPSGTPNCTGNDTVECVMNNVTTAGSGVISLAFDAKGDLFYSTSNIGNLGGGTAPNSIWECTAACLYTGTPAAQLLFTEPTSSTPTTTGQLNIGGLALDAYGDLFFTDSAVNSSGTESQESFTSNVNELVYSSSTGYATSPTILYTHTPANPSNYDDELDGVAVDASGTLYALIQNTGGIIAFPNNAGVINTAQKYLVSPVTGKLLATDGLGNLYVDAYIGGDAIVRVGVNNLVATATPAGTPSTASNVTTLLNDGGCSPAPTLTFTAGGAGASAFSAATTGTCSSTLIGGSFATNLTFSPTAVGLTSATLTATDSLGNAATAMAIGNATGTVATPTFSVAGGSYTSTQTVSLADATAGALIYYTTDGSTPAAGTGASVLYTGPITVATSETINAIAVDSGDTSSAIATATYTINLPGAALTPTFSPAGGDYSTPQDVTISDGTSGATIYYTTDGSVPTTSSNVYVGPIPVAASETLNAIAVASGFSNSAVGSALYTITLPPSAFQNIVMTQSTQLGSLPSSGGAQSGSEPAGDTMAVNSFGDLIATDTYGNETLLFTPGGGTPTVLGTTSNPNGVAVDAQNNLYMGFSYNNAVVKIPFVNGTYAAIGAPGTNGNPYPNNTPNCTGNDTTECVMSNVNVNANVVSIIFDAKGDMFFATGLTNYGIYECTLSCQYSGSPAPTVIYTEPSSATPATTGQLNIGGLALDAAGDLFFTDSAVSSTTSQESFSSNLKELAYTAGTGYATTPTLIYNYVPAAAAQYGAEIDGVAVAPNGTVYALVQAASGAQANSPAQGILAFPYVGGAYSSTTMYLVSTQSGKLMTSDGLGNLYIADNNGSIYQIAVDTLTAPIAPQANPENVTNITTYLNDGGCTTPPTVTFTVSGPSASAFTATTTGTCTATPTGGASYATTLNFDPTSVGTNTATLTATDSLGNTGTAALLGVGTPAPPAPAPTFSVAAGTYTTVQTVALADTVTTASIYYTLDGSTPTSSSNLYTAPITVSASETINAIATATGYQPSPVATEAYVINLPVAPTPTFSVAAGTYTTPQTVSISDSVSGVAIYYTTDGSTPAAGTGTSQLYSAPLTLYSTATLQAIAVPTTTTPNYTASGVATALYTINLPTVATPTFSVAAGTYAAVQTVSISDATSGASIYYTLDGTTPTAASTPYTGPITVALTTTIEAIAIDSPNYNNSPVATALYTINLPPPGFTLTSSSPTVTVTAGKGSVTLTLTANAAFNGNATFSCSGFLPNGATCAFSPAMVSATALGTATTQMTVTVPQTSAQLHRGVSPILPGTMLAAMLGILGLGRKRRRLQVLLVMLFIAIGINVLSGCATTTSSTATSSQMIVNSTGCSLPVNPPPNTTCTAASASINLVLDNQ